MSEAYARTYRDGGHVIVDEFVLFDPRKLRELLGQAEECRLAQLRVLAAAKAAKAVEAGELFLPPASAPGGSMVDPWGQR